MMRTFLAGLLKRSAVVAHNLVSQVVVSVTAAICVALISNAYFEDAPTPVERPAAARTATEAQPQAAAPSVAPVVAMPKREKPSLEVAARLPMPRPALPAPKALGLASLPEPTATAPIPVPPTSHGTEIFSEHAAAAPDLFLDGSIEPPTSPRLLGVPLPGFVPTSDDLAESVEGARAKFGTLIDNIRD